jgi:lysophospholipase L1-like esterase
VRERVIGATLALVAVIGALGIAELGLRVAAPIADPYVGLKIRRTVNQFIRSEFPARLSLRTDVEPGLPGMVGPNRFTTNNVGFRGDSLASPKPLGEYRVFLIGGSSAECLYLDDADALNAVVQRRLRRYAEEGSTVRVYGAGKSGDRSDDHVSMVVHRIAQLEPDLIVVLAGINDLSAAIFGHDFLHYTVRGPGGATTDTLGLLQLMRITATEFQLPRRLFYLVKRATPPTDPELLESIPLRSNYRALVEQRRRGSPTTDPPPVPTAAFRANLRTIVAAARANGAATVLMTQQATWASTEDPAVEEWQWLLYRNGQTYDAANMYRALEELNDVTREVAAKTGAPLHDLARTLPKTREYLYDDVHFTVRGAQRAGEELAALVREIDGFPRAPSR